MHNQKHFNLPLQNFKKSRLIICAIANKKVICFNIYQNKTLLERHCEERSNLKRLIVNVLGLTAWPPAWMKHSDRDGQASLCCQWQILNPVCHFDEAQLVPICREGEIPFNLREISHSYLIRDDSFERTVIASLFQIKLGVASQWRTNRLFRERMNL